MRLKILIAAAMLLALPAVAETTEEQLISLERQRSKAIASHDAALLNRIYAEDFRGLTAIGYEVDKQKLLDVFKQDDGRVQFELDELRARVVGRDVALVTGRLTGRTTAGEITGQSRYMHVYAFRDGRWQIVAGQGTVVQAKK